jgi:hypothetical protein
MRTIALFVASLALMPSAQANPPDDDQAPIPASCPVTVATSQTRFTPPLPSKANATGDAVFWYGTDALYTFVRMDAGAESNRRLGLAINRSGIGRIQNG